MKNNKNPRKLIEQKLLNRAAQGFLSIIKKTAFFSQSYFLP